MVKLEKNKPNALINEKSPYLLQHAYNPVKWLPWGKEAIDMAKKEDKPILLSIGYSTCHWCHVMEKESFEDEKVAEILNKHFISIKVDREERPDIDEIYMRAVQRMTGGGGWPLNVFLTTGLKPFYGGTYFPSEPRHGLPSFIQILESINKIWQEKREKIVQDSDRIIQTLKDKNSIKTNLESISPSIFQEAYESLTMLYDSINKGFGSAPKFPMPTYLSFLLRHYHREGIELSLKMVTASLNAMALGGIYDQLAGGFHRYSTDKNWMVPHFEKMLYDNALLALVYLNAYQKTQDAFYSRISKEILDWILDEMMRPKGGFYSAQDADVNGEEGTFYVWDHEEVYEILGKRLGDIAAKFYGISVVGNFNGRNILFCRNKLEELSPKAIDDIVEAKKILLKERRKRKRPHLDDKIITSWNALSISSMTLGYQVLKEKRFLNAAKSSARLILDELWEENKLYRYFKNGRCKTAGFLEDYSFLVSALIDLYETTFNLEYLRNGLEIHKSMIDVFLDEHGGFYDTEKDSELPVRVKTIDDGAIPSGNSIAISNLIRLSELTGKMEYKKIAETAITQFKDRLWARPVAFTSMLNSMDLFLRGVKEIVVAPKDSREEKEFLDQIWSNYIPNKVVAISRFDNPDFREVIPFVKDRIPIDGATTVYVCENNVCKKPITDLEELKIFLGN